MQEELLSKKELLELTGISYGQLYRWKRQKLIPETWFIKQSAFTGQETFFPKEKILKRVKMIIELKDQYSLEELAALLSPEFTGKLFEEAELLKLPELDSAITAKFKKILESEHFAFKELLFIYVLSELSRQISLSDAEIAEMAESIKDWLPKLKTTSHQLIVCRKDNQLFSFLLQQNSSYHLDHETSELKVFDLDEFTRELNLKLNQMLEES